MTGATRYGRTPCAADGVVYVDVMYAHCSRRRLAYQGGMRQGEAVYNVEMFRSLVRHRSESG